jgi:hypothetical protein
VDCSYEKYDLINPTEINQLRTQLMYCVGVNKMQEKPINLIVAGIGPSLNRSLTTLGYQNWEI